jgi:uncharacterized OB-fold protein
MLPIKQYQKNSTPANQPRIMGRQCDTCGTMTPFSELILYRREFLQYAPFNQQDRVGKMVCPSCLPPNLPPMDFTPENNKPVENTVTASKVDILFAEIFKCDE